MIIFKTNYQCSTKHTSRSNIKRQCFKFYVELDTLLQQCNFASSIEGRHALISFCHIKKHFETMRNAVSRIMLIFLNCLRSTLQRFEVKKIRTTIVRHTDIKTTLFTFL